MGPIAAPRVQSEAIRAAIDEADRLLATFNALLSIAESESGRAAIEAAPLDLADVARSAAELYEPVAEEKGFALSADRRARRQDPRRSAPACRRRSPICSTTR